MKPDVAPTRLAFAFVLAVAAGSGAAACHSSSPEVVVYTSVDQVFSQPVFRAFEAATGFTVRPVFDTEETKSTGVLNRLVDVASGIQDTWADPRGEYASAYHASPVYRLLGKKGLSSEKLPPLGQAILDGDVGYHVREGGHSVELYDWQRFMDFADRHLKD